MADSSAILKNKVVNVLVIAVIVLTSSLVFTTSRISTLEEQVSDLKQAKQIGQGNNALPYSLNMSSVREMLDMEDPEVTHAINQWDEQRRMMLEMENDLNAEEDFKNHIFEPHGAYGFVRYAGYRVGASQMVTIGLGSLPLWNHRNLSFCQWKGNDGAVINGTTKLIHGLEHHDLPYHVIIIWCYLKQKTAPGVGGKLYLKLDFEKYVVYGENDGDFKVTTPRRPFMRNITHCSPPIHHGVHRHLVKTWLDYHMTAGIDHFVLYDVGGIDWHMRNMLQPYIDAGVVEITDFKDNVKFPSWYYGQVLIINDCIYRFRFSSQWIAYIDFDEYIWVKGNKTLHDILREYKDKAFVQHGTVLWKVQKCLEKNGKDDPRAAVERAVFRNPEPFCRDSKLHKPTCHDYWGHRKYFGNPRRLVLVENHKVVDPYDKGVSLSTDVMLHQHLRGLVTHGFQQCSEVFKADEEVEGLVKDTCVAEVVKSLRENPLSLEDWKVKKQNWEDYVTRELEKSTSS